MTAFHTRLRRTASLSDAVGAICNPGSSPLIFTVVRAIFGYDNSTTSDAGSLWELMRCTTLGTGTSVTPVGLNPYGLATTVVAAENHSANPTTTSNSYLLSVPMHSRNTFQFFGPGDKGLVVPATASNGIVLKTPVSPLIACTASFHHEQ